MRLALLGPAEGDVAALARAAATALDRLEADRVVYLGTDEALDAVAAGWATLLSALPPLRERVPSFVHGDAIRLELELTRERDRARLARLHNLAGPGVRSLEMMHDRLIVIVDDKRDLDEEDLIPASIIVFGAGPATIRRVGSRVFLSPGSPRTRSEGIVLLDEGAAGSGGINASLLDVEGNERNREFIEVTKSVKMRVHGTAG